jgi:hypothetical protein
MCGRLGSYTHRRNFPGLRGCCLMLSLHRGFCTTAEMEARRNWRHHRRRTIAVSFAAENQSQVYLESLSKKFEKAIADDDGYAAWQQQDFSGHGSESFDDRSWWATDKTRRPPIFEAIRVFLSQLMNKPRPSTVLHRSLRRRFLACQATMCRLERPNSDPPHQQLRLCVPKKPTLCLLPKPWFAHPMQPALFPSPSDGRTPMLGGR